MKDGIKICGCALVAVLFILFYGKFRCDHPNFKDPLLNNIVSDLDGWSLTHLGFYMLMGYLFPDKIPILFLLGVLWEIIEFYMSTTNGGLIGKFGFCQNVGEGSWWFGRYSDIIVNGVGLYIGYKLNKMHN